VSKSREQLDGDLARFALVTMLLGIAAAIVCLVGHQLNPKQFFQSYLYAFVFWLNIPLGLLGLLMLQHLVGGNWGAVLRGVLEGGTRTLPFMAILFLPIALGVESLYEWSRWTAHDVAKHPELAPKVHYLNDTWFLIRAGVYFVVWCGLGWLLLRWSRRQQRGADERITRWLAKLSGVGMLLGGLAVTFAAIDWVMSLEPLWYSTIYGLLYVSSEFVTGMAFAIVLTAVLDRYDPLSGVIRPADFQDLGSLLLAFVIVWSYMAFSQFIIIWTGDIVEELQWYMRRAQGSWGWLAVLLIALHFALPFVALLSKQVKRDPRWLAAIAILLLVMHLLNDFWLIVPAFGYQHVRVHWLDVAALVAVGSLWLAMFAWQLRRQPAVLVFERSS
jgi:hypothetical protein